MNPPPKKSFGQHFLHDPSVVKKVLAAAAIESGEQVLEIGPGTGILTEALVAAGARVTAVEADRDLIAPLKKKFGSRIDLVHADFLHYSIPPQLQNFAYKIVANLPYNITSDFFQRVFTLRQRPSRMIVMVQREVADRITGKPPNMSLLTVVCQLYAEAAKVLNVPPGAFRPAPKVDSAVIRLDIFKGGDVAATERIIALAKTGFSSKRKQLHNNLTAQGSGSSERIKAALVQLGYRQDARAENVHTKDWRGLSLLL